MNEPQAMQDPYPWVKSELYFSWLCEDCFALNYVSFQHWLSAKGLEECHKCEKAHKVKEPWC